MAKFPFYRQLDQMDCGPTCLRMIAKYYGKTYSLQTLREKSFITREGVSLLGISEAAEAIGLRTLAAKVPYQKMIEEAPMPLIAHWRQRHFVVVYGMKGKKLQIADPAHGLLSYTKEEFLDGWISSQDQGEETGVVMLLEPTPEFYEEEDEKGKTSRSSFKYLFSYLTPYKRYLIQLFLGMFVGSLLQFLFPFLTQSIVDIGIQNQNIGFINLILIGQLMLFISQTSIEFLRLWLLLNIGMRMHISIISDFLIKLMKLPISFFETKMTGDLLQRIQDHNRIRSFLTGSSINIVFATLNLIIFGAVLAYYSLDIFLVFLIGSLLYVGYILIFLKRRRTLDYKLFDTISHNQNHLIQLISGIQEIKLHNSERQKRWVWERIQAKLYKVNIDVLVVDQYQKAGSGFINQLTNIFITFLAAKAVIDGEITLGMMLAVQYIIGQLNGPITQITDFAHQTQDAKIAMERLGEIHMKDNEEEDEGNTLTMLPSDRSLNVKGIDFHYEGPHSEKVLNNVELTVPHGKVTAIVGASGSGKTTLIKLLLKFYNPSSGEIRLGDTPLASINNRYWREKCGAVLQDGYIFSDTIANNIAVSDEYVDKEKLLYAVKMANVQEFIESLPLGYNTKIGDDGHGLSQGQKQRILIARAVYKNPEFMFFDEATNALDANNEKVIIENLNKFFEGRTVVVVAHRLSTVKNADQIIVLNKGEIVERGTHEELTATRGAYYELVKNQLELGN